MLYIFIKYNQLHSKFTDINHRTGVCLCVSRKRVLFKNSVFFRKLFFRTLLMYMNVVYCNFSYTPDQNFFYFTAFIHATYTKYHPGFYYKHAIIL